jgi:hypothetical protein
MLIANESAQTKLGRAPLTVEKRLTVWPAAGFVDTQFGCFMKREVEDAKTQVQ